MIVNRHDFKLKGGRPIAEYTIRTADRVGRSFFIETLVDGETKGVRLPNTEPLYRMINQQFPSVRWGGEPFPSDLYMSAADLVVLEMLVNLRTSSDWIGG